MKKLTAMTCISVCLLSSNVAQATWQGNWLIGGSGAYNWYDGELNHTLDFDAIADAPMVPFSENFNSKGWSWGILGGYQWRCNPWLLGVELNVDWHEHDHTQNYIHRVSPLEVAASVTAALKRDSITALTFRLGYEVMPCLLTYLRAGIERMSEELDVVGELDVGPFQFQLNDSQDNHYRFIGGFGAEAPIPMLAGLTFRTEYNYHRGPTLGSFVSWTVNGNNVPIFSNVNARQHINTVKASLVYNFTI